MLASATLLDALATEAERLSERLRTSIVAVYTERWERFRPYLVR